MLFDLEPGVIDSARASPLGELFRPGNLVNKMRAREATGQGTLQKKQVVQCPVLEKANTQREEK